MATSRKRVTVNLGDQDFEYLSGMAQSHGKTLSWALAKVLSDHRTAGMDINVSKQVPREVPDYDTDNPFVEKASKVPK